MNLISKCNPWKLLIFLIGFLVLLVVLFYVEEDWRGKRAWEQCKAELEAKGETLDWNAYIPPPVPDDQNFFMASTNILLRFKKVQTDAEYRMVTNCHWLRIEYSTNSFRVFDTTKTNPLIVAEMTIEPSSIASSAAGGSHSFVVNLNAADAREQVQDFICRTVGRGIHGAAGFQFSELQLRNLTPTQIVLQSDTLPSIADLQNLIPEDLVTNLGHLRIEATSDQKSFHVLLTGVHVTAALDYLKWSDQFVPAFDEIREALKRLYALIPGDYSQPFFQPIPNFVTLRAVAQTLAQRAQCEFLLGRPDQALRELTLMHDLCRVLEHRPIGQPITLVEAMINVAITGLYVNTIADGFRLHAWQEPQLVALQEQLKGVNLSPQLANALRWEMAASTQTIETTTASKIADMFRKADAIYGTDFWTRRLNPLYLFLKLAPRGWLYQNMVNVARPESKSLDGFDLKHQSISPRVFGGVDHNLENLPRHKSPFKIWAALTVTNTVKATQVLAYNQTQVNEAQVACALERYRLAHGEYPEALDALVPQFIEKLPHDIIGGQPLHYRRTGSGKFLLYSVGWNETDDGGEPSPTVNIGPIDYTKGDWVWKN